MNPLSFDRYRNSNFFKKDANAQLPDSMQGWQYANSCSQKLTVPNQLDYNSNARFYDIDIIEMQKKFPDAIMLPDSTVIDSKTGKIILDVNFQAKANGMWAKEKEITHPLDGNTQWNDAEIYQMPGTEISLDKKSKDYWSRIEQQKNISQQSELQKQLLIDLENGNIMPKSKLVED